jgi:hypothetical protein
MGRDASCAPTRVDKVGLHVALLLGTGIAGQVAAVEAAVGLSVQEVGRGGVEHVGAVGDV